MEKDDSKYEYSDSFVDKIALEAAEEFDKFVFKTVKPYCERVSQMSISKELLSDALVNYKGIAPDFEGGGLLWVYVCGECHLCINQRWKFCPECGRRINWRET